MYVLGLKDCFMERILFLYTFLLDDRRMGGFHSEDRVSCVVHVIVNSICRDQPSCRYLGNKGTTDYRIVYINRIILGK